MALRTVTMSELRLEVLLEAEQSGESVAEICRRYKISRETYYRYRRRYLAAGMEGLEDRSRRPKVSPGQIDGHAIIDVSLTDPSPHRLDPITELLRDPIDGPMIRAQLLAELTHQPDRLILLGLRIPTRRRLPL
jgi:transposase-like protein